MTNASEPEFLPLLGDLSDVPAEYIRQIASMKRVVERWVMDPRFRQRFEEDAEAAIASLGVAVRPEEIVPLVDPEAAQEMTDALREGEGSRYPASVRRYRAFFREKRAHRRLVRQESEPSHPRLDVWRKRQIKRCIGQLGPAKADALVHAPAAFELAQGCTVGCWFCGVAAPKFEHTWPYTEETRELWRGTLGVMREVMGPCIRYGFLYWATDPLDNPEYERFLVDFHDVTGRCPQTTTAIAARDLERTRELLRLSHSLDSSIDRFSIITLKMLQRVHDAFTPEELLRVELIPQNREAQDRYRKANAGRARQWAEKRAGEVVPEESSSTIACVSGFLFNMPERSVRLVTPCNASERWPLGYWTIAEARFDTAEELESEVRRMVDEHMPTTLGLSEAVRLRPDLELEPSGDELRLCSRWIGTTFAGVPAADELASLLAAGSSTAGEIALAREASAGIPLTTTLLLLDEMFGRGLFDEDPARDEPLAETPGAVAATVTA